jgi:hypothetical protein
MTNLPEFFPHTIYEINKLPSAVKHAIYKTLIADWVYERFNIDPVTLTIDNKSVVTMVCQEGSWSAEVSVFHQPDASEPSIYVHLADSQLSQLMVLLVIMGDPDSERFNIDTMPDGTPTNLGTTIRNLPEEIRAMNAGLAPGQTRFGLRGFRRAVPFFEEFVKRMRHDIFLIEPLSYHNAIIFERYGFSYVYGKKAMEEIHRQFMPGGEYHRQLDGSNLFRQPDAWQSIRGRSWAIHDGIMGHPFTGFHMVKRVGHDAQIETFPGGIW